MDIGAIIGSILGWLGQQFSSLSSFLISKFSELTGKQPNQITSNLISLVILFIIVYIGTKIANKTAKYILIILGILLIIATFYTLFV
jgi:hypothetical protein